MFGRKRLRFTRTVRRPTPPLTFNIPRWVTVCPTTGRLPQIAQCLMNPLLEERIIHGSIRYIKGVGPRRLTQLAQLGVETVEDACYYPPRRYEDRTHLVAVR